MGLQEVDACEKKMVKANCDGQEYENVRALHFHFSCGIFIFGLTTAQVNIMNLKLVPPQVAGVCSTATATATDIKTDQGWLRTRTRTRTPPSCSSPPSSETSLLSATNFQGAASAKPSLLLVAGLVRRSLGQSSGWVSVGREQTNV